MNATVNSEITIFLANFSELTERFDPTMILYNRKVKSFKYETMPLKSLLTTAPQYGANEIGIVRTERNQPRYIRITDIDEFGLLNDSMGVTANTIDKKYFLRNNDILFARSGATVGKAYLHKTSSVDYKCFFAGYMIRFVVDENKILPDYLFTYTQLSPYREWVKAIQRAAGQPNINSEEYKSLKIPLPALEIQRQIVAKINQAYEAKLQREEQAQAQERSITTYILKELGITIPVKNTGLESRVFTIFKNEIDGRFDPLYYYSDLSSFNSGHFESVSIGSVSIELKSGFGAGKQDQASSENGIIQVRPTNITENGILKFDKNVYLPYELRNKNDLIEVGDVLFNNTNSQELVGKTAILEEPQEILFSNHITRIRVDKLKILPKYLWAILNVYQQNKVFYSICTNWNNQSGIGLDLLKSINIPLPPLYKQGEIIERISDIHYQVKQLQNDASEILEAAKREIEEMILG
ncbi:MAG: restriction endonuclease subunit S [Chitinophagales bacterium]